MYLLLYNNEFQATLAELGFNRLGSGWFGNDLDNIRLRIWNKDEIDFWFWRGDDDNTLRFRGKIYSIEDVKWVLERCFEGVYK